MTVLLDRWQFAVTILFHYLFVPLTISLALLVAVMQTLAYRRHDADWDRLARFFGHLFLINFAVGVVTGIVQEFQFGMNWSQFSVFVGDIFGAPLAIEGLLAFFVESTFIGLWIFGRGRLSPRLHLATIWLVSLGTMLSAFVILAANAWMQHPVGYRIVHHRAVLTNFWALLTNSTLWVEFPHTLLAAFVTGGMVMLGVSVWRITHGRRAEIAAFTRSATLAAGFSLVSIIGVMVTGDLQARVMDSQQPMKMAAAEALYSTKSGASFSLLTIGNLSGRPLFQIRVPHLLSLISDMSWNGTVAGIDQTQAAEAARYGAGGYTPVVWLTYWSFRAMVGLGMVIMLVAAWTLIQRRRARLGRARWFGWVALGSIATPFLANSFGWIFTEAGRQPWVVNGLLRTSHADSPSVGTASVAATLAGFVALYTVLGVIDGLLMARAAREPLGSPEPEHPAPEPDLELVY